MTALIHIVCTLAFIALVSSRSMTMMASKYLGKSPVFIAGGSNGVGLEVLKQLSSMGTPVHVLARREVRECEVIQLSNVCSSSIRYHSGLLLLYWSQSVNWTLFSTTLPRLRFYCHDLQQERLQKYLCWASLHAYLHLFSSVFAMFKFTRNRELSWRNLQEWPWLSEMRWMKLQSRSVCKVCIIL